MLLNYLLYYHYLFLLFLIYENVKKNKSKSKSISKSKKKKRIIFKTYGYFFLVGLTYLATSSILSVTFSFSFSSSSSSSSLLDSSFSVSYRAFIYCCNCNTVTRFEILSHIFYIYKII